MTAFCSSTALSKREKLEDDVERPLKEFETCVVIHSNDLASGGRRPKKRLKTIFNFEILFRGAVVVAQLVERSLPIPEIRGSNPAIGKNLFIYWTIDYCQLWVEKTKIKKKRPKKRPKTIFNFEILFRNRNVERKKRCNFAPSVWRSTFFESTWISLS